MTPGPGIARTPLPQGFTVSGINCGVRKYRPDLGIILSDRDAAAAGVFTTNQCKAAPVLYSQELLPSGRIRAVITNSGQANAATGERGKKDNFKMVSLVADGLGCDSKQVLVASTGVIGHPLDMDKISAAIPQLLDRQAYSAEPFASAILTTDLVPKTVSTTVELSGGSVTITGIAKGSGMIHPNMATMLGYLLTDCQIPPAIVSRMLRESNKLSFNRISVDGDTSTNDCVFMLANGASGIGLESEADYAIFQEALTDVARVLAKAIARDGEGAGKLIEVNVIGAPTEELAETAARGITRSPLVKSAIYGNDPNWGRVLARLGADQVPGECLEKMQLELQGVKIFVNGAPFAFDRNSLRDMMKTDTVAITVDLASGEGQALAWGCDLTERYVQINAEYN